MTNDSSLAQEVAVLLTRIQEGCRSYPTQRDAERRLSFATIRTAAETIGSLAEDDLAAELADDVRSAVNRLTAALDDLSDSFGSDADGHCRCCGQVLAKAPLGGGSTLRYCTRCPTDMLEAVREISDLTGAEVL